MFIVVWRTPCVYMIVCCDCVCGPVDRYISTQIYYISHCVFVSMRREKVYTFYGQRGSKGGFMKLTYALDFLLVHLHLRLLYLGTLHHIENTELIWVFLLRICTKITACI